MMRDSLPIGRFGRTGAVVTAVWLLLLSTMAVALAPLLMSDSYSWIENTISESAGQGVHGAWLARSGFLLSALAVLVLCSVASTRWGYWGRAALRLYAFGLIAGAIFSRAPWTDVPYDRVEAFLHTLAVFWSGVGFALGVLIISFRRPHPSIRVRVFDLVLVFATPLVPLLMLVFADQEGALQRCLALAGYVWLIVEAIRLGRVGTRV